MSVPIEPARLACGNALVRLEDTDVVVRTPDKIEMPVEAVRAPATFSESDLGSYTLEYLKNDWYITN
ncbi:hypothetical protein OG978_39605 [Streptomyces sp. NBC_01591]|uniref:hypothetical protein n=1 Tax=Streptomyces sp. NBC_01591 TaxID=2975888 RepID=UPI002DDADDA0|nr:hypothetical protein [Streptomyces sp. NBC_01591]WSD72944.1 hypothetical protein OG978_39605 [Streptomyces sp. NBC_01591]